MPDITKVGLTTIDGSENFDLAKKIKLKNTSLQGLLANEKNIPIKKVNKVEETKTEKDTIVQVKEKKYTILPSTNITLIEGEQKPINVKPNMLVSISSKSLVETENKEEKITITSINDDKKDDKIDLQPSQDDVEKTEQKIENATDKIEQKTFSNIETADISEKVANARQEHLTTKEELQREQNELADLEKKLQESQIKRTEEEKQLEEEKIRNQEAELRNQEVKKEYRKVLNFQLSRMEKERKSNKALINSIKEKKKQIKEQEKIEKESIEKILAEKSNWNNKTATLDNETASLQEQCNAILNSFEGEFDFQTNYEEFGDSINPPMQNDNILNFSIYADTEDTKKLGKVA